MIRLENVKKVYKVNSVDEVAITDLTMDIKDGEFIGIIGPSGSGKSTLLNCIGMLDEFSCGRYFLNDEDVTHLSENIRSRIRKNTFSFIFQNFELIKRYTVYENIEVPLLAKRIKGRKKIIDDKAEMLGIGNLLNKYPYQISGGEQQRAAIVRALVMDNPFILADEPTGALDKANSSEFMKIMHTINDNGKTILMVTHNLELAKECDKIIELSYGEEVIK